MEKKPEILVDTSVNKKKINTENVKDMANEQSIRASSSDALKNVRVRKNADIERSQDVTQDYLATEQSTGGSNGLAVEQRIGSDQYKENTTTKMSFYSILRKQNLHLGKKTFTIHAKSSVKNMVADKAKVMNVDTVTVKQLASGYGCTKSQIATLKGLRLNKIGKTSTLEDTKAVRGMIKKVHHLISIL